MCAAEQQELLALVDRDARVVLCDEHDAHRWVEESQVEESFMWRTDCHAVEVARREILSGETSARASLRVPF